MEFHSLTEMLEMFRKTGAKGGKARAANMSAKERSEAARQAAKARWAKAKAAKIICYHATTVEAALGIHANGFVDQTNSSSFRGVWVSNRPLDFNEGAKGDVVLRLVSAGRVPDLRRFEVSEEGKPYREWCVPARMLNRYFSWKVADWGFISLRRAHLSRRQASRLAREARRLKLSIYRQGSE